MLIREGRSLNPLVPGAERDKGQVFNDIFLPPVIYISPTRQD
jgi:hypothetical protein